MTSLLPVVSIINSWLKPGSAVSGYLTFPVNEYQGVTILTTKQFTEIEDISHDILLIMLRLTG